MSRPPFYSETLAAQALGDVDPITRAVVPALHPATTFLRDPDNQFRSGRVYARADNPTFDPPEALLARLEGAAGALCFASGMAAATSVFLALEPGDHVVAPRVMYWALRLWLRIFCRALADRGRVRGTRPDRRRRRGGPARPARLVWVETPGNPTWPVTDLAAVAGIARPAGARLAVDYTVPTPVFTRPIDHGADLVMHSATKYLNGHPTSRRLLATARTRNSGERIRTDPVRARRHPRYASKPGFWQRGMRTLDIRGSCSRRSDRAMVRHFGR